MKIEEIMDLIAESGEKCFILKNESAFVLLTLPEYRRITGKTLQNHNDSEKEGLTKPNNDIRVYEIPRLNTKEDSYLPESLG